MSPMVRQLQAGVLMAVLLAAQWGWASDVTSTSSSTATEVKSSKALREEARQKRLAERREKWAKQRADREARLAASKTHKGKTNEQSTAFNGKPPVLAWQTVINGRLLGKPATSDGKLYVTTSKNTVVIINKADGTVLSQKTLSDLTLLTPPTVITHNQLLIGTEQGLLAVNPNTGMPLWQISTPQPVKSAPMVYNQTAYFASQDGKVTAISPLNGQVKWTYDTGQLVEASPVVDANTLYIADYDGNAYAIDSQTGQLKWQEHIEGPILSPALLDAQTETVYFSSAVGAAFALFTGNGKKKWSYTSTTGAPVLSQPVSMDGHAYIADADGRIGGTDLQFGVKTWQTILDHGGVYSALTTDGQSILALTAEGTLLALDPENGQIRWQHPFKDLTPFDMVKEGPQLFIGSQTGKIYAFTLDAPQKPTTK